MIKSIICFAVAETESGAFHACALGIKKLSLLGTMLNNFFSQQNTESSFMQMILCFMKMQGKGKTGVLENKKVKGRGREMYT